jgi:hypothetical protein
MVDVFPQNSLPVQGSQAEMKLRQAATYRTGTASAYRQRRRLQL